MARWASSLLLFVLSACTPVVDGRPVDPGKPITFFDSEVFDSEVSRTLAVAPETVTVVPAATVTVNAIPVRLNAWMAAVQARGGNVQMIGRDPAAPNQPQFISILLPIATAILAALMPDKADIRQALRDSSVYGKTDQYDLKVYYVPGSGTINELVFVRRS
jgi:hypothetical protein